MLIDVEKTFKKIMMEYKLCKNNNIAIEVAVRFISGVATINKDLAIKMVDELTDIVLKGDDTYASYILERIVNSERDKNNILCIYLFLMGPDFSIENSKTYDLQLPGIRYDDSDISKLSILLVRECGIIPGKLLLYYINIFKNHPMLNFDSIAIRLIDQTGFKTQINFNDIDNIDRLKNVTIFNQRSIIYFNEGDDLNVN